MRIALLAGSLIVAFAAPAPAQLPPAHPAAQSNRPAAGPTMMRQRLMAPGIPGQQNAALDNEPAGAAMGPETYADPSAQGQTDDRGQCRSRRAKGDAGADEDEWRSQPAMIARAIGASSRSEATPR